MTYAVDYVKHSEVCPAKKGKTDKYSWNFFRYLKKHKGHVKIFKEWGKPMGMRHLLASSITQCTDDCCKGKMFIGVKMYNLVGGQLKEWSYYTETKYVDVTKKFMEEYKRIGVCVLDPQHVAYGYKWDSKVRVRTCTRCGMKQKKKIEYRKEEHWVCE